MAIYHASTKPIARSGGRSSVAAAAYRAGCELVDERTGLVHNYTRRAGVVSAEILTPDGGSADRSQLWNAAELAEKRKDSRTAREWIVALPSELDAEQRAGLARAFG
ncbi:MobA/MobL family protein, partial [Pseudomonas aeruginosa]|nr:MobA/MobL family protein [Pseudomonas aeruginosa]